MIRTLIIVAVAGFIMATACIGAAFGLGGRAIFNGNWDWASQFARWDNDNYSGGRERIDGSVGPESTREIPWTGTYRLEVSVPAEIQYTQGPVASVKITGPKASIDNIVIDDGKIKFDRRMRNAGRIQIVMTAPSVTKFDLYGSQHLTIDGYDQDTLDLQIAGSSEVTAKGRVNSAEVEIMGSGEVDLGGLASQRVKVEIAGSGDATIAPTDSAEVEIAGSGDVTLLTRPKHLDTQIAGSGKVTQPDEGAPTPAAPAAPATPAAPAKTATKA